MTRDLFAEWSMVMVPEARNSSDGRRRVARTLRRLAVKAVVAFTLFALNAGPLSAQSSGARSTSVAGVVRDSSGASVAGADVSVDGTRLSVETAADGMFRLYGMAAGMATITVRRLGFRPLSVPLDVRSGGDAERAVITLARAPQQMAAVVVVGNRPTHDATRGMQDRRRKSGSGHYFSRADIENARPQVMTDLIRRIPGARLQSIGGIRNAVRFRNAKCPPLVWLDGLPLGSSEFDIDNLTPSSIEAIEVYSGFASTPAQFTMTQNIRQQCGAIVIWSRQGEASPRRKRNASAAAELATLIEAFRVYSADQVDVQAQRDTQAFGQPAYPDSLLRANTSGDVLAEFVVDTAGRVLMEHFSIVSSTHPLFSDAVERALPLARFIPAQKSGKAVRQAVQWPFRFRVDPDARAAPAQGTTR